MLAVLALLGLCLIWVLQREPAAPVPAGSWEPAGPPTEAAILLNHVDHPPRELVPEALRSPEFEPQERVAFPGLDRALELHGYVLLPDGQPCADAAVFIRRPWHQGFSWMSRNMEGETKPVASLRTNSFGEWRRAVQPGAWYEVEARWNGLVCARACLRQAGERVVLQLGAAAAVSGTVTLASSGLPLEGLEIRLLQRPDSGASLEDRRCKTGAEGSYRFDKLPPGGWRLLLDDTRHEPIFDSLNLSFGQEMQKDLTLNAWIGVSGLVRDAVTKEPIHGAEVSEWSGFDPSIHTDEFGRFEYAGLDDHEEEGVLLVRAPGYGQQTVKRPAPPGHLVLVDLIRGRTVTGRVVHANATGARGVFVALTGWKHDGAPQSDWQETVTRSDGRFTLRNVRTDLPHGLLVHRSGSGTIFRDLPDFAENQETVDLGTIQLEPASIIVGRVLSAAGEPVASCEISISGSSRPPNPEDADQDSVLDHLDGQLAGVTDDLGRFRFGDLAPGQYSVSVQAAGYCKANSQSVHFQEGGAVSELLYTLRPGVMVKGKLVTSRGSGVEMTTLLLNSTAPPAVSLSERSRSGGEFTFHDVSPGTYRLTASVADKLDPSLRWRIAPAELPEVIVKQGMEPLLVRM